MFGIQEDGTFTLTAEGTVAPVTAPSGFVVALGKLVDAAEVVADTMFGRWTDQDGTVYWDRVVILPSLEDALKIARTLRELAIWDMGEGKEIRVNN